MSPRAGLALGSLVAMVAALPAAARVASQGGSFALGWLLLAGGSALVLGPVVALARNARPLPVALLATLAGAAAASIPLAVLARLLHKNTHHRPLGAATFAVIALALVAFASFAAWRALAGLQQSASLPEGERPQTRPSGDRPRWLLVSALGVTLLAAGALLGLSGTAPEWRGSIVDGGMVLALVAISLALRLDNSWSDRLARLAIPAWTLLVVIGVWLSRAQIGPLVGQAAPVLSPLNGW